MITGHVRRWGVILAGGDGERLRSLTRFVAGDDRPKQFCPLLEDRQTLLDRTRRRVAQTVPPDRTVFVVTRHHESFYSSALADIEPSRIVVQPSNRGTLAAILLSLIQLHRIDPRGTVAFFPSDHYYSREGLFVQGVDAGFAAAETVPDSIILLGARAHAPETGYGYIEPGAKLPAHGGLQRVGKFWEKPTVDLAQQLLNLGCLWNTFVMFGAVRTFLQSIRDAAPAAYGQVEPLLASGEPDQGRLAQIYDRIPTLDFSKIVLTKVLEQLAVLDLGDIGWSDLGDPQRLLATLSEHGIPSPWRQPWLREMGMTATA